MPSSNLPNLVQAFGEAPFLQANDPVQLRHMGSTKRVKHACGSRGAPSSLPTPSAPGTCTPADDTRYTCTTSTDSTTSTTSTWCWANRALEVQIGWVTRQSRVI